uniref:Ras-GEF domain-containing protein n=1 Tax=Steinernema glaseri TaxID=37863 RepID=A0A1I7ZMI6_9BILA
MLPHQRHQSASSLNGFLMSGGSQPFLANPVPGESVSAQIRDEIQRFESVHPCLYTLYDLVDMVKCPRLQDQLRQMAVHIEGWFFVRFFYTVSNWSLKYS